MDMSGSSWGQGGRAGQSLLVVGFSCQARRPVGCSIAGAPHKANHSLGIYIWLVRMDWEGLRWWRRAGEGLQESGERPELGQVLWKCKERVGSGEVERKSPENMMPRCGRKQSKDKDGFSFSSLGNSERAGTRSGQEARKSGGGTAGGVGAGDGPPSCDQGGAQARAAPWVWVFMQSRAESTPGQHLAQKPNPWAPADHPTSKLHRKGFQ